MTIKRWIAAFVLIGLYLCAVSTGWTKEKKADYFPLKKGCWWRYRIKDTPELFEFKAAGMKKVNGYNCHVVESRFRGRLLYTGYYAKQKNKVLKVGGVQHLKHRKIIYNTPENYLVLPLSLGLKWRYNHGRHSKVVVKKVTAKKKLKVPAGAFDTLLVVQEPAYVDDSPKIWYAPEVGVVKMTNKGEDMTLVFELVEYSVK